LEEDEKEAAASAESVVSATSAFAGATAGQPGTAAPSSAAGRAPHPLLHAMPDLPPWQVNLQDGQ
jgi:hypothetical protein